VTAFFAFPIFMSSKFYVCLLVSLFHTMASPAVELGDCIHRVDSSVTYSWF